MFMQIRAQTDRTTNKSNSMKLGLKNNKFILNLLNKAIYKCRAQYTFITYPVFYAFDMYLNTSTRFSVIYTKIYCSDNVNYNSFLSNIICKLKRGYNM